MNRTAAVVVALVAVGLATTSCSPSTDASADAFESSLTAQEGDDVARYPLQLQFGLGRSAESSSLVIDVCARKRTADTAAAEGEQPKLRRALVETPRGRCVQPEGGAAKTDLSKRPAVLATTVLNDLRPCGSDAADDRLFPADQITATSELVGATSLRVRLEATPVAPTTVEPGTYCGRVVIERDLTRYESFDFVIGIDDRGGAAMWKVLGFLLLGAALGVLIRFLNDPVSRLVQPYRRYLAAHRWVYSLAESQDPANRLRGKLLDVEDALNFLDVGAADLGLKEIEALRAEADKGDASLPDATVVAFVSSGADRTRAARDAQEAKPMRSFLFRAYRVYWLMALVVLVIGIVAIGFVTRYIDNDTFAGTERDWAGLVIFGLAAQVTASTLAESLGRLLPSTKAGSG